MSVRAWFGIALVWGLSVFAVGSIVSAQIQPAQIQAMKPVAPKVLAGPDVGFRVEATQGDQVVGQIVVKVNDKWVDAVIGSPRTSTIKPLK